MSNFSSPSQSNVTEAHWSWTPIAWEWWEILQLIFALVGIAGNLLVMLVLFRPRRKRCSTDTLIAALAVADFLSSIFIIPHSQVSTLPNTSGAQLYCRIIHSSVLMWISICASIFTLTTISIERFTAVRYPFLFKRIFTLKRTALIIVFLWVASAVINTLSIYVNFISDNRCIVAFPSAAYQKFIGVSYFLVEYLLPVGVMVVAHILTIQNLRMRAGTFKSGNDQHKPDVKLLQARRRVMEMLFIVVVTFIICWTPDQFGFLAFNLGLVHFSHLYSPLYRSFVVLAFVNSCANPIIYAARNPNFRRALKELFQSMPTLSLQYVFAATEDASKTSVDKSGTTGTELNSADNPDV